MVHFIPRMNLHWHIVRTKVYSSLLRFTLGVVHSLGWEKCIMTYIYHYNTMQVFSLPWNSSVLHLSISSLLQLWQRLIITVAMVLSFPRCHRVGIPQYVAFSNGFFHLVICIQDSSVSFHGLIAGVCCCCWQYFLMSQNFLHSLKKKKC